MARTNTNGASEHSEAELAERTTLVISVPLGLKIAVEKSAETAKVSSAAFMRDILAKEIGYTLPASKQRVRKYATEEERAAALKQRAKERQDLVKALLEKYRKGEVAVETAEPAAASA